VTDDIDTVKVTFDLGPFLGKVTGETRMVTRYGSTRRNQIQRTTKDGELSGTNTWWYKHRSKMCEAICLGDNAGVLWTRWDMYGEKESEYIDKNGKLYKKCGKKLYTGTVVIRDENGTVLYEKNYRNGEIKMF